MTSILIIDDEINIIKSFQSLLSSDYDVYSARNSRTALDEIKRIRLILYFLIIILEEKTASIS